jgi:hypothetical protein
MTVIQERYEEPVKCPTDPKTIGEVGEMVEGFRASRDDAVERRGTHPAGYRQKNILPAKTLKERSRI